MKRNLLLYILLAFLVVMNGFFLFKQFSKSGDRGPKGSGQSNFIVKELNFDAAQTQKFEEMDAAHRKKIKSIFNDLKELKDGLFDKLSDDNIVNSEIDSFTTAIAEKEKAKELETFNFFRSVGELCTEKQKARFNTIIHDAIRRGGPRKGRNGPPPGGPGDGNRPPPPPRH